jgi:NAD(P)-dependent dehydrogenase (short-subunit alcohol dehydrogenase family)
MSWSESDMPSQQGRFVVVTGTGGLGYEAGRALAQAGAEVVLAGRNPLRGHEAIARIHRTVADAPVRFEQLDLADLASIRTLADRLAERGRPIDILVNNAGVMGFPERRETRDGFELQFGTNHLGHFALTMRLLPLLLKAPAPRVVSLGSSTHKIGRIDFDDLQATKAYSPNGAYGNSKLATLMFALELDRRAKAAGVPLLSNAAHPGIARTDLMSNGPTGRPAVQFLSHLIERLVGQSPAEGTLPVLRAATDPASGGGEYYGPSGFLEIKGPPALASLSKRARDRDTWRRLWEVSEQLTGVGLPQSLRQVAGR